MNERADLLPCLRCEGEPLVCEVHGAGFRVICPDCKCKGDFFDRENDAVDQWNGGAEHRETLDRLSAQL